MSNQPDAGGDDETSNGGQDSSSVKHNLVNKVAFRMMHKSKSKRIKSTRLLEQFYLTLDTSFDRALKENSEAANHPNAAKILEIAKGEPSWQNAYHIEQLMVELFAPGDLDVELKRRLVESGKALEEKEKDHYAVMEGVNALKTEEKRSLLARLVNDLQWAYTKWFSKSSVIANIMLEVRIWTALIVGSFVVLVAALVVGSYLFSDIFIQFYWLGYFVLALAAGAWGACFSMLSTLQDRLFKMSHNDVIRTRRFWFTFSRLLLGNSAAAILYVAIAGGLLSGQLFPDFDALKAQNVDAATVIFEAAKLVFWSILAGYSETLIPSLLSRYEERIHRSGMTPSNT